MDLLSIQNEIKAALDRKGLKPATASRLASGNPNLIKNINAGHMPRVESLARLAEVLDVNFNFGGAAPKNLPNPTPEVGFIDDRPPYTDADIKTDWRRLPHPDPLIARVQATMQSALDGAWEEVRELLRAENPGLPMVAGKPPVPVGEEDSEPPATRPVPAYGLAAAAGAGSVDLDSAESRVFVWFRKGWLDRMGLNATQCIVIGVRGESMEPTLPEDSAILVNRAMRSRREGKIYVVQADDGLVVKRAGKDTAGNWLMLSDHSEWKPARWLDEFETVGQVRWMARTL